MMHMNTLVTPTPVRVAFGAVSVGVSQNTRTHASI